MGIGDTQTIVSPGVLGMQKGLLVSSFWSPQILHLHSPPIILFGTPKLPVFECLIPPTSSPIILSLSTLNPVVVSLQIPSFGNHSRVSPYPI